MKKKLVLNLGSGISKRSNEINLDINRDCHPDVIHDLNKFPYPFKTNTFYKIKAFNILEHLDNLISVMEELHRISEPKATVEITTGHFSSADSYTDPTHKHFFTSRTFDYFIPGKDLYKYRYSRAKFKIIEVWVGPKNSQNMLLRFILWLINIHVIFYETRLAFIFPVGVIYYKLQVLK